MSDTASKVKRIEELVEKLNQASEAYYNGQDEIMSNFEWDAMFDELTALEDETGHILSNSPTQNAGYETSNGKREEHEYSALSLAKTKKIDELVKWAEDYPIWLSWKLDGCTLVLTYDDGKLVKILTRGNGTVGTNITHLKTAMKGFPLEIDYKGHLCQCQDPGLSGLPHGPAAAPFRAADRGQRHQHRHRNHL